MLKVNSVISTWLCDRNNTCETDRSEFSQWDQRGIVIEKNAVETECSEFNDYDPYGIVFLTMQ
jgi:hypothetical protein